jgi:hypothetical protein
MHASHAKKTALVRLVLALLSLLSLLALAQSAFALEASRDGWFLTGSGVRTKSVAFVSVKVYAIRHEMKQLPAEKSKRAVLDADVDKRFTWTMLRDVDAAKIQKALTEGYAMNGYADGGKIQSFLGAMNRELSEGTTVTIAYNAATKTTTLAIAGGASASVPGIDFMRATWSLWFGKIDQPSLGDAMIANL